MRKKPNSAKGAPAVAVQRVVSRWNFNERLTRGGAVKDYPDEWVCATCAWAKSSKVTLAVVKRGQKKVWCCKAERWMWHKADRLCYEEPLEVYRKRKAANVSAVAPATLDSALPKDVMAG